MTVSISPKDIFYFESSVGRCESLVTRACDVGLKVKDLLDGDVTVCITSINAVTGDKTVDFSSSGAAPGVGQSRGRRRDRIQRMIAQAQTEQQQPGLDQESETLPSVADKAREVGAAVISGLVFENWLRGLEFARVGARRKVIAKGAGTPTSKDKASVRSRVILPTSRRKFSSTDRFKSQEHPRVVIKDLDGLEPDRVQAFPPELMRKCNLHADAPPGICPFTPREQWSREVLKQKRKVNARPGDGKEKSPAAVRMPAGSVKPRRGGYCECCERQYIGTMSEHCASNEHQASMAKDPNLAVLLALASFGVNESDDAADQVGGEGDGETGPVAAAAAAAPGGHENGCEGVCPASSNEVDTPSCIGGMGMPIGEKATGGGNTERDIGMVPESPSVDIVNLTPSATNGNTTLVPAGMDTAAKSPQLTCSSAAFNKSDEETEVEATQAILETGVPESPSIRRGNLTPSATNSNIALVPAGTDTAEESPQLSYSGARVIKAEASETSLETGVPESTLIQRGNLTPSAGNGNAELALATVDTVTKLPQFYSVADPSEVEMEAEAEATHTTSKENIPTPNPGVMSEKSQTRTEAAGVSRVPSSLLQTGGDVSPRRARKIERSLNCIGAGENQKQISLGKDSAGGAGPGEVQGDDMVSAVEDKTIGPSTYLSRLEKGVEGSKKTPQTLGISLLEGGDEKKSAAGMTSPLHTESSMTATATPRTSPWSSLALESTASSASAVVMDQRVQPRLDVEKEELSTNPPSTGREYLDAPSSSPGPPPSLGSPSGRKRQGKMKGGLHRELQALADSAEYTRAVKSESMSCSPKTRRGTRDRKRHSSSNGLSDLSGLDTCSPPAADSRVAGKAPPLAVASTTTAAVSVSECSRRLGQNSQSESGHCDRATHRPCSDRGVVGDICSPDESNGKERKRSRELNLLADSPTFRCLASSCSSGSERRTRRRLTVDSSPSCSRSSTSPPLPSLVRPSSRGVGNGKSTSQAAVGTEAGAAATSEGGGGEQMGTRGSCHLSRVKITLEGLVDKEAGSSAEKTLTTPPQQDQGQGQQPQPQLQQPPSATVYNICAWERGRTD